MSEFTKAMLVANIFRYLLIPAGLGVIYMGYRLFVLGYFEKSGELEAKFGPHHLIIKQAAPGVFFAVLGAFIIATGVFRRMEISVPIVAGSGTGRKAAMSDAYQIPCKDDTKSEIFSGKGNPAAKQRKEDSTMPPK